MTKEKLTAIITNRDFTILVSAISGTLLVMYNSYYQFELNKDYESVYNYFHNGWFEMVLLTASTFIGFALFELFTKLTEGVAPRKILTLVKVSGLFFATNLVAFLFLKSAMAGKGFSGVGGVLIPSVLLAFFVALPIQIFWLLFELSKTLYQRIWRRPHVSLMLLIANALMLLVSVIALMSALAVISGAGNIVG